ncbi:MAG: hypothetical protein AUK47_09380 [Deltaproteobacteria bacterium CG2_30_63_29]|nr:MAG: hypothetical protein AUK47_09380 [Deltaproteobacteria bacterium CG2_30_63_29]PIW01719.1 MAG: hypothetical protein COW42_04035 [Deltaproteobacteria bacterium CG17_big_fil_post_rev_8_21_14_2_50_63_7]
MLLPQLAASQTWRPPATGPFLREVVAVDASGEANWPFGSEDNAKDGATFGADEARLDIRTVYAASDADRFWLRAYFAETQVTTFETTVLFVFMDSDDNPATGSGADAPDIFSEFTADPTPGGYDTVIGVQGDGSVLGVWSWENNQNRWGKLNVRAGEVEVESSVDLDPILLLGEDHAYLQMSVDHILTGLDAACNSTLFVRSFNDATSVRYGDLNVGPAVPCVARDVNADGSPDILQNPTSGCRTNADCPGQGVCLSSGVCLIRYQCRANSDCAADEACTNGKCVRVVTTQCTANADCNKLLCEQGACVPCAASGARACASGLVCAPNGTCTDPGTVTPPPNPAGPSPDVVQGGACMCSLASTAPGSGMSPLLLSLGFLLVGLRRRRTAAAGRAEAKQ